ncbi:cytochrome c1 [Paludibacterium yongneupense]|uniref:cytochrome c1 n=1 Tax=Paludibacterium yongneupense TaxID=400061 RepID=UPI00048A9C0D|nr:cytochrome c1 [Paludibacterium yongneupense]
MKKPIRHLLAMLALLSPLSAFAAEGPVLEKAPIDIHDTESLQRGAQVFVNYCLSCHSATSMRYSRLTDIGLSEEQIKASLLPPDGKIGDLMRVSMDAKDAKLWLANNPPDLSVEARSRGADWIYAYLRGFYRDPSRPTGWNNAVFDKVAMPHVLWQWQGDQVIDTARPVHAGEPPVLKLVKAGTLTSLENGRATTVDYDRRMADLTNFLVYMGEPAQVKRQQIGYAVLMFLGLLLLPLAYFLKKEYWRDVH